MNSTAEMRTSDLVGAVGIHEGKESKPRGWFTRAVTRYMRADLRRHRGAAPTAQGAVPEMARGRIRRSALVSAGGGALTGAISTAATVVTAQTEGVAGFIA